MGKNLLNQNGTIKRLISASIVVNSLIALIAVYIMISVSSLGISSELLVYIIGGFVNAVLFSISIINFISKKYNSASTIMIIAGVTSIPVGIIAIILGAILRNRMKINKEHKFLEYKELAKKAEFNGQIDLAIDYYMDSLYHLEYDFKNLKDKKLEDGRQNHIKHIKEKVESLNKQKLTFINQT